MLQEACQKKQTVPMLENARVALINLDAAEAEGELISKMVRLK